MPASATPAILAQWMAPFQPLFTRPTWQNLLVLVAGAILAPGRRTVTSALSMMGLREMTSFTNFHRVLNRNRWLGARHRPLPAHASGHGLCAKWACGDRHR